MRKLAIIALTISFLAGCAATQKGQFDEYDNSIHIGNKIIQINKEFKYIGDLRTSQSKEYTDGVGSGTIRSEEHFFMHLNIKNKIDKFVIIYSHTLKDPHAYWRGESDFSNVKNYKSHMHMGRMEINKIKCACVVKKWPSVGKRYTKYAKEKGYEFDMSKGCLIETKIGKTIGKSTMIAVSYLEGIDNCENVRNIEGENPKIIQDMLSKLRTNVNMK